MTWLVIIVAFLVFTYFFREFKKYQEYQRGHKDRCEDCGAKLKFTANHFAPVCQKCGHRQHWAKV
jgi:hypothetical protein